MIGLASILIAASTVWLASTVLLASLPQPASVAAASKLAAYKVDNFIYPNYRSLPCVVA